MTIEVVDVPAAHRYEARQDGAVLGYIQYRQQPDALVLVHTEVGVEHEGKGVGSALIRGALDDIRAKGGAVVPMCPFVAGYIRRHPDYLDVVAPDYRDTFAAGD